MKELLLIEKSNYQIQKVDTENKYVFEGIFTEFDSENRNGRIYTKKEFMPHFESLKKVVEQGKCLGELDHPKQFETSLKNVSHIVDKVWLDEENNRIMGRIRLLDTDMGKQAKALVDAGVPLHISSRAAGSVTENKTVKVHKLFTYDLVDTPGFENAVMNSVNESYGFSKEVNENTNFFIYEVEKNDKKENVLNKIKLEDMSQINENEFSKYSQYTKEQIGELRKEIEKLRIIQEGLINQNDEIVDEFNKVDFDALKSNSGVNESANVGISKLQESIDELTKKVNAIFEWSDEVTETVSALESWSDEATTNIKGIKSWSEEVTETVSAMESWSDEATKTVSALENWSDEATKTVSALDESKTLNTENVVKIEEGKSENFDTYKNLILEKLENIVTKQQGVTNINESVNEQVSQNVEQPLWLESIPSKFKASWEALSEGEQLQIKKRADLREFKTSLAIKEFWNTQFTKENLIKEEKTIQNQKPLNENQVVDRRQSIIESYRRTFG